MSLKRKYEIIEVMYLEAFSKLFRIIIETSLSLLLQKLSLYALISKYMFTTTPRPGKHTQRFTDQHLGSRIPAELRSALGGHHHRVVGEDSPVLVQSTQAAPTALWC